MRGWLLFFSIASLLCALPDHVVVQEGGSRFGDQLLAYIRAKWISYRYEIPFRYRPFPYSTGLALHNKEPYLKDDPNWDKRMVVTLQKGGIDLEREDPVMYICPFFPEDPWEIAKGAGRPFEVDWKDPKFREMIREMVAPKRSLKVIVPPKYSINIAMHVREGGGVDPASVQLILPLKLPPMTFYTEALQKILPLFPSREIYCQIFTDALEPEKIVNALQAALPPDASVQFGYRTHNRHDANVLKDFFSLFNFDVLIRPQSNFSIVPSLIHDYAIVYSPVDAVIEEGQVSICKTEMAIDDALYQRILRRQKPWWRSWTEKIMGAKR